MAPLKSSLILSKILINPLMKMNFKGTKRNKLIHVFTQI